MSVWHEYAPIQGEGVPDCGIGVHTDSFIVVSAARFAVKSAASGGKNRSVNVTERI